MIRLVTVFASFVVPRDLTWLRPVAENLALIAILFAVVSALVDASSHCTTTTVAPLLTNTMATTDTPIPGRALSSAAPIPLSLTAARGCNGPQDSFSQGRLDSSCLNLSRK